MDDFLLRALVAGCGLAIVSGVLGVFIVWRRMAYFGDTIAHSALLGVALGFVAGVQQSIAVMLVAALIALGLQSLSRRNSWSSDTLLGILSHSALALGLVVLSLLESVRVDLLGLLFGDILAVDNSEVLIVLGGGCLVLALLVSIWRPLIAASVHGELARVEGVPVTLVESVLMLIVAAVIAMAMKIVGVLLITALLIIPAATARRFSRTPLQMAMISAGAGIIAVLGGLAGSWQWDTPAGPSIVLCSALLFVVSVLIPLRR